MITNIRLENFKCFRELDISPKLVTVLIGANGTGKSSVLQSLVLLKQWVGQNLFSFQGEVIDFSGPADFAPNFLDENSGTFIGFQGSIFNKDFQYSASGFPILTSGTGLMENPEYMVQFHHSPDSSRLALKLLRFVPAARGLVRPQYRLGDEYVDQVSLSDGLGAQEEQLASNLAYNRPSEESLSGLLKKVTGTGLRAETTPPQSVAVKSTAPSGAVNIVAEGFGANALILLLHQLLTADKGATVLIEEPEIHLHPKAQAELAEVLADTAKAEDKQIIMTTHSEYVAGRLLTLVAEKRLGPDELAIYSFEKDEKGECFASEIEVLPDGRVRGGLKGFFENEIEEVNRYMRALTPKQ